MDNSNEIITLENSFENPADPKIREYYRRILSELKRKYPWSDNKTSLSNPFTEKKLINHEEYDEYLRLHSIRLAYDYAHKVELAKLQDHLSMQLASKQIEINKLNRQIRDMSLTLADLKNQRAQTENGKRHRLNPFMWISLFLFCAIIISLIFWILPARSNNEAMLRTYYERGYSEGYSSGRDTYTYESGNVRISIIPTQTPSYATSQPSNQITIPDETQYVLNTSSKKFHKPECGSVQQLNETPAKSRRV